jgi:spermidine synthase
MPEFCESPKGSRPYVRVHSDAISLHFDNDCIQSMMSCGNPNYLEIPYTKTMMCFLLAMPYPEHILMIGLGGGSLAKFCYRHLPKTRITVVEICPDVIALRDLFKIPEDDDRFCVVCADGADFVRDTKPDFDVIHRRWV